MQHYGLVNAGFSQLALSAAGDNDTLDVVAAAADDYSDGIFDGLGYGEMSFPSQIVGLPGNPLFTQTSAAFSSTFAQAIATIQGSSRNQSGFTIDADGLTQVAEASFDSSNVLTLDNNGCVVADRNVPSGSHITVRDIEDGVVTLRNAFGEKASSGGASDTSPQNRYTRVGLVANGDPFSAATVQLRCTVANFAQGNTFLGDRGNGTISVSPRFTIRDARPNEVGTWWPGDAGEAAATVALDDAPQDGRIAGPSGIQSLARVGPTYVGMLDGLDGPTPPFDPNEVVVCIRYRSHALRTPTAAERTEALKRDDNDHLTPRRISASMTQRLSVLAAGAARNPAIDITNIRFVRYLDLNRNGVYRP